LTAAAMVSLLWIWQTEQVPVSSQSARLTKTSKRIQSSSPSAAGVKTHSARTPVAVGGSVSTIRERNTPPTISMRPAIPDGLAAPVTIVPFAWSCGTVAKLISKF
jgi:hypothetical protein